MSAPHFCVRWDSYKNNVSKGLSRFQQNGEFVDMTLAAAGHLVKVHQNIVALASPYIKAMIQSAACPHPVVFLNNVGRKLTKEPITQQEVIPEQQAMPQPELLLHQEPLLHQQPIPQQEPLPQQEAIPQHQPMLQQGPIPPQEPLPQNLPISQQGPMPQLGPILQEEAMTQQGPMPQYELIPQQESIPQYELIPLQEPKSQQESPPQYDVIPQQDPISQQEPVPQQELISQQDSIPQYEPMSQQKPLSQQESKSQEVLQSESSLDVLLKTQADLLLNPHSKPIALESQQETLPDLPVEVLPDSPVEVCSYSGFNEEPESKLGQEPEFHLKVLPESQQKVLPPVLTDSQEEMLSELQLSILPPPNLDTVAQTKPLPESQLEVFTEPQLNKMPVLHLERRAQLLPESILNSLDTGSREQSIPLLETQPKKLPELLHEIERVKDPPENNFAAHITINSDKNINLEFKNIEHNITSNKTCPIMTVDNFVVKYDNSFCEVDDNATAHLAPQPLSLVTIDSMNLESTDNLVNIKRNIENNISDTGQTKQNLCFNLGVSRNSGRKKEQLSKEERDKIIHYTVSNRGSLQLMLNSYIYCCHHQSCGGRRRRWRCGDYRKLHCPAFIDTDNDEIINRSDQHNHASHDSKILKKFKSKLIFTSVVQADETCKTIREKEAEAAEPEYFKPKAKRRKFIA
ncbi:unnamed protein product [Chrysodeixis includens]|uniref:BTB domain-containing protein n=1 Tax=Chrysodeixis includens TaxID=689277 RepID=A0A9P0BNQ4_CHRIL|nr:unnamed protein product [Chrysodeixis includens]